MLEKTPIEQEMSKQHYSTKETPSIYDNSCGKKGVLGITSIYCSQQIDNFDCSVTRNFGQSEELGVSCEVSGGLISESCVA